MLECNHSFGIGASNFNLFSIREVQIVFNSYLQTNDICITITDSWLKFWNKSYRVSVLICMFLYATNMFYIHDIFRHSDGIGEINLWKSSI